MKNCLKNDSGVIKVNAQQSYEDVFGQAIKNGKMSEARMQELLAKISQVASNDVTAFDGLETDIKLYRDGESGSIVIDMLANWMKSDED